MSSPFPGMNPYLEQPQLWAEVHARLIVAIADALTPYLRPKYRVAVEQRVYQSASDEALLVGIPDVSVKRTSATETPAKAAMITVAVPSIAPTKVTVPMLEEVRERYLAVREVGTQAVITVIELLSPKNKRSGEGRRAYENKRQEILSSLTHLVEIDLLREGQPMPVVGAQVRSDYRILVSRSDDRPTADLYAFNLPDPIPTFSLPLRPEDTEPTVDVQTLLQEVYERAGFDLAIDYTSDPIPTLNESSQIWLETLLKHQQLRS
ncbi:DUF4058 family protein [Pantanalinema rosaneae CENA516]|uniref:DUF4058 family protein n=1 Tax=Pantanalinema rosaneae TaxID=1620701 RepID=UPI003D6F8A6A